MPWVAGVGAAIGGIASGLGSASAGGEHKGVSETLWKDSIPGITDLRGLFEGLINQSPSNPNIEGGLQGMANLGQTLSPMTGYGSALLGASMPGMAMLPQLGMAMAGFNPYTSNAGFTPGQAAQANYNPALAQQITNGAPIDDAIQAATRDMWRGLNWDTLPQLKSGAAASGNSGSSKFDQKRTLAEQMTADRSADVAAQMKLGAYGKGVDTASQYGLTNAGMQQQMGLANTELGNESVLRQSLANAGMMNQYGMNALTGSADIFGNLLNQGAGMFSPLTGLLTQLPQMQYQAGLAQRDNSLNYYQQLLNPLMNIATGGGTAGQAGYSPNYGQPNPIWGALGQIGSAAIQGWNSGGISGGSGQTNWPNENLGNDTLFGGGH